MVTTPKKSGEQTWTWSGAGFTRQTPSEKQTAAPESSLLYKRARYYDQNTGEFISRDPLGFVDGMSLYRAYFVPGGVDPLGLCLCNDDDDEDSPHPKDIKKVNVDTGHLSAPTIKWSGGKPLISGGHIGPLPTTINGTKVVVDENGVKTNQTTPYTITYKTNPDPIDPAKPYKVVSFEIKDAAGNKLGVSKPSWTVFPHNWGSAGKIEKKIRQGWNSVRDNVQNEDGGNQEEAVVDGVTIRFHWNRSCDKETKKWKIEINSAFPVVK